MSRNATRPASAFFRQEGMEYGVGRGAGIGEQKASLAPWPLFLLIPTASRRRAIEPALEIRQLLETQQILGQ